MKHIVLISLALLLMSSCDKKREGKPRILIFSKTMGFKHGAIPAGITAIQKLGQENGFDVDTTKNAALFNQDNLKKYSAVVFLSTTGDVLDYKQEAAFERYIQSGGGYVGVHAATDTEYDWGWYGRLVGAFFSSHPKQQEAKFIIKDKNFPATAFFTDTVWQRKDELYNFKKINPDIHVLITIDESSYEGGTNGAFHPMSWYHEFDGGRAFYTALGHTDESYVEDNYLKHLLAGIQYAIGDNKVLNYTKAKTQLPLDEDRFTKTQLATGGDFYEPTEITVLPNLDILISQRRGSILLYKGETKTVKQVGFLNVYCKSVGTGVNVEEGLLGMAKDPNFEKNHWIYVYYSPADTSVNRLSRFTFEKDTLDLKTEKTILEVKSQREICCHTGGSIAFGPDGLLYVSSGDNSTPFDEKGQKYVNSGFGPLNDTPGHKQYDARRSSSNTNDLRGKIMRIRVKDDATYEIPDGNLFPKGTDKTRPEIYVMGTRNPYRISVDQKNSTLYWGEVGPDANNDSLATRGPRGYDEVNQARKAGYFGWPLFVGNNFPYHQYNYETGESGPAFDPLKPINDSRNNTGLRELPPVSPAFIWYPYGPSSAFPQVGSGSRNAMAGPVYYTDLYPKETRLPDYYNGKLIIYEWIRGWIKAVTLLPNGDFDKMEPFAPGIKLNSLIDMEVGPDGKLYLLEYGSGWYTKNADAGLARIDYVSGNRAPRVTAFNLDKTTGVLPFSIKAYVEANDPEKDKITYTWNLGDGQTKETATPELEYTYTSPGDYQIFVEVKDSQGAASQSEPLGVYAGNGAPEVAIQLTGGNKSFYLPGYPLNYAVTVEDKNDTSKFDPTHLFVSADFSPAGRAAGPLGHQQAASGKALMLSLDCKSCHKESEKSIGPAYTLVAQKYAKDRDAENYLTQKIINGGKGVWGEVPMAAHAALPQGDALSIVKWILTLANASPLKKSLPQTGSFTPTAPERPNHVLVLSASYTDQGGNNIKALTGSERILLPSNTIAFSGKEQVNGFLPMTFGAMKLLMVPASKGWFLLESIDLSGVKSVSISLGWQDAPTSSIDFELRMDAADGQLLGKGTMPKAKQGERQGAVQIPVVTTSGSHNLYFVYAPKSTASIQVAVRGLVFNSK